MYRHYILQNINYRKLNDLFNDFCCFELLFFPHAHEVSVCVKYCMILFKMA